MRPRFPRPAAPALLALVLAGCDDGASPDGADEDTDGWTVEENDCDDQDPTVHPGATEVVADGIDQNCDGGDTCYRDVDGDGYGSTETIASANLSCQEQGESTLSTDCGDGDPDMYPDALEITADERDQDCDGGEVCYQDADADGFGSQATVASADLSCQDQGESTVATDCDDGDPDVNPDAEEICNNRVDDDCDGSEGACDLEGEIPLTSADAKFIGEEAGDDAGWAVACGDTDGDGRAEVLVGATMDSSGGTGAVYLLDGPFSGTVDLSAADARLFGEEEESDAGAAIAVGDVDGDAALDLVIGAPSKWKGSDGTGAAYLVYGPVWGEVDLSVADARLVAATPGTSLGHALAAGDVDDDGAADLIVGAYGDNSNGINSGAAYVVYGPFSGDRDTSMTDAVLEGEESSDYAAYAVASGDVDGDGNSDVLVGAPHRGDLEPGAAYLVLGPAFGRLNLSTADAELVGGDYEDLGYLLATGDANDDGLDDVIVFGHISENTYLFLGPLSGTLGVSEAEAVLKTDIKIHIVPGGIATGDVDGDGALDILIGDRFDDAGSSRAGAAYLAYGPFSGEVDLAEAGARFVGETALDQAGSSVAAGDVDGDGLDDVLIGARYEDEGGEDAGAAYLLLGGGF